MSRNLFGLADCKIHTLLSEITKCIPWHTAFWPTVYISTRMNNNAMGREFYSYLLSHTSGQFSSHDNLVNRCMSICQSRGISLFKYLFLDDYVTSTKCIHISFPINDVVIDSITHLLSDFTNENRVMLQSLLPSILIIVCLLIMCATVILCHFVFTSSIIEGFK